MLELTLDMEQYDCPFIDTTEATDVSFAAVHWEFDSARHELETRMLVEGADPGALENGLGALADHENMRECTLLSKQGAAAQIRTTIDETDAMGTIRANEGYITGPFHIREGAELWHVGFDREPTADETLEALDRANEFDVVERERVSPHSVTGFVQNVGAAMTLVEGCRDLSPTERRTLEAAVDRGYFESPRGASLGDLAEQFGVSKTAVSKNLRRAEGKTVSRVTEALEDLE
jgi:predicted DNA binding protein